MANSVPVTALTADAVYGANNITVTGGAIGGINPCLPYLQISTFQIFASTTNDRTAATMVGTTPIGFYAHTTAVPGQQYWYWAKSVDASGAVSDFYPATSTSPVTATAKTSAGLTLTMSAPAIVVPADSQGAVTSFAGAVSTARVMDGNLDVTGSWSFSAVSTGVTVTQSGAAFTLTALAGDNGYFDVSATRTGYPALTARVVVSESKTGATGAAGANAAALRLTASSQVFQVTAAGANSPASITFTAELLGGLAGTPTFSVTEGTATLTGSGLTRTLSFANLSTDTATIQATLSGSTDTITVAKIREGATGAAGAPGVDAVVALLSNEAHTLQADNAGVVGTFVGAATTITIYEGITNTTASWTLTRTDVGVTSTLSGTTVTITAMAGDTGYVSITATRSGYSNITKRFSLTKARAGAQGVAGADAQALRLTASSQVFQITAAGANSPASITFTATNLGGLAGSPTFSVTSGTATLTGTGASRTLTFANLGTDTATIEATVGGFSDTITVAKIREGATGAAGAPGVDAVVALLSNEAHTLQADNAGVVGTFVGAATTITIYEGITNTTALWTLTRTDVGTTSTLSGTTVTLTAMAGDTGYVSITATRSGYTNITKRFSLTKARAGASAPLLRLSASSQIFQVTAAGANSPASITFTAELLGGLSGTPTFSVPAGTATLTGTGLTRTLTYANLSTDTATIEATVSGSTDTITVAKLREGATGTAGTPGAASVVALLSNEAHTLAANSAGTVSSFAGAVSTITIYEGLTDVSASYTVTKADTGVTSTLATRTVTITAMSADTGYVDITATRSGYPTIVKRFALAKSRQGSTGSAGADAVTATLSKESHVIPCDMSGAATSFTGAASTISIFEGDTDVSTLWTVAKTDSSVTSTLATRTVTVSAISADAGYVDLTASRSGYSSITKRFSLAKGKQGSRGSKTFYVSGQSAWSDTVANSAANADIARQLNDVVTQYNASTFSQTKYWNGSSWVTITQAIDGNLLISGSVGATQISASYVYAGTISATQVTAGTFTGRTFQTASSGKRVVIDASANTLAAYDTGGSQYASIGGDIGGVAATIVAYTLSGATTPGILGVTTGVNTSAGVQGNTQSSGPGVRGTVIGGSTGHAIQGTADVGSGAAVYASVGGASATSRGHAVDASVSIGAGSAVKAVISGTGTAPAISALGRAASADSHGIRGQSGGSGLVGVSTSAGSYAFYKESGGIAPFTGQHDGLLLKTATDIEPGDIIVDVSVVAKPSVNDAITIVERSSQPNQATCVGVFVSRNAMGEWAPAGLAEWIDDTTARGEPVRRRRRAKQHDALAAGYDLIVMNSLGEGLINVCNEGGDIAAGDLIVTSSRPGKGMKQDDDIVRARTVAKAREGATFTSANQVKMIACIYLCG